MYPLIDTLFLYYLYIVNETRILESPECPMKTVLRNQNSEEIIRKIHCIYLHTQWLELRFAIYNLVSN